MIRRPGRVSRGTMAALALAGVVVLGVATWRFASVGGGRAAGAGAARLGPGAAVMRGTQRIAGIERVVRARGRGRLPLYLAPASGPVVDSARVGVLAARLVSAGTATDAEPVIALVPRDSARGLPPVGRLVITPGEPGLLVFGAAAGRP